MNLEAIARGKEIILDSTRSFQRGVSVRIPVADDANIAVFQQALSQPDIQSILTVRGVGVEFYIPDMVQQAKDN